jgi:hypothetical protein
VDLATVPEQEWIPCSRRFDVWFMDVWEPDLQINVAVPDQDLEVFLRFLVFGEDVIALLTGLKVCGRLSSSRSGGTGSSSKYCVSGGCA